jgi:hypothetical protein
VTVSRVPLAILSVLLGGLLCVAVDVFGRVTGI